jgi:hypothetical protein
VWVSGADTGRMSLLSKVVEPVRKVVEGVRHKLAGVSATNPKDGGKNK